MPPFPNSPQQDAENRRGHRKPLKSIAVMHPWVAIPGLPEANIAVVILRAQQQDERQKLLRELGGQLVERWINCPFRPVVGALECLRRPNAHPGQSTNPSANVPVSIANAEIGIGCTSSGSCHPTPIDD